MRDDNTPEYRSLLVGDTRETFSPGTVGYELLGMVESLHARARDAEIRIENALALLAPGVRSVPIRTGSSAYSLALTNGTDARPTEQE